MTQNASNIGVQISLEISRIKPIRDVSRIVYDSFLDYGRRCRRSGSDVMVEADLAALLGRVLIREELEKEYRNIVRIQSFVPLYKGCEVRLDAGAGPTVQNSLRDSAYLATVIQISMLAYFHNRVQLAGMISKSIAIRFKERVKDALPDPGQEGISKVIEAISSQTYAFGWHFYSQKVEDRLRTSIPDYLYQTIHSRLSQNVILGALDFFYSAQNLPGFRQVSLSTEAGCIPIIVWAHHILNLNLVIKQAHHDPVIFGNPAEPQVFIQWTSSTMHETVQDATIRLHQKDRTVILKYQPDTSTRFPIDTEERHSVLGYGTVFLRRVLNMTTITVDNETVYKDSVKFVTALAIRCASRISWMRAGHQTGNSYRKLANPDTWRILNTSKMVFEGLPQDIEGVRAYVEYDGEDECLEKKLPISFNTFLNRAKKTTEKIGRENLTFSDLLKSFRFLVKVIIALSLITDVEACGSMPIFTFQPHIQSYFTQLDEGLEDPEKAVQLDTSHCATFFLNLLSTVRDAEFTHYNFLAGAKRPCLWSDFGWSVFLDTVGDKDPAEVQSTSIHVKQGVPTMEDSNERRHVIVDSELETLEGYPDNHPILRGTKTYVPRSAASCKSRSEIWSIQPEQFELSLVDRIEPSAEWQKESRVRPFEQISGYAEMLEYLSDCDVTTSCEHAPLAKKSGPNATFSDSLLGPDAAILLGWRDFRVSDQEVPERVLILLTRGEPAIRWHAVNGQWGMRMKVLVSHDCCENCALEIVSSSQEKTVLIL